MGQSSVTLWFLQFKKIKQSINAQSSPRAASQDDIAKAWAKRFEEVDRLEVMTNRPIANLSYTKSYSTSSNSRAGRGFPVGK